MPARKTAGVTVVLVGFMASGKTEVGRVLAERLGGPCVDTDQLVESCGLTIPDIFASEGETGFRRREAAAVKAAAAQRPAVISTGGGAVLSPENVNTLRRAGLVVYLAASEASLWGRLAEATGRPLIDGERGSGNSESDRRRRFRALLGSRTPVYEGCADVVVETDGRAPDEIAADILARIGTSAPKQKRPRRVTVATSPPYDVVVGRGLLERAGKLVAAARGADRAAVISHPRIVRLWGEPLRKGLEAAGVEVHVATFPEGEARKTVDTAARLYRRLAAAQLHRSDLVVCLGGGVAGDVGGFVASTYLRGVACVQVPTTLLAMVDSAIGGKTGVNLSEGKNLVGTFTQPSAVIADLDTIKTLPERELRGGLAEVVKYACIADPALGERLLSKIEDVLSRGDVLLEMVMRSARIKAEVVADDEREGGRRAHLNYGHTLGHALEAAGLSSRAPGGHRLLHHGEAISIGMRFAAHLAEILGVAKPGLVDHHVRLLEGVGLPTTISGAALDELTTYMRMDKKYEGGLRFVLLEEPGRPVVRGGVPEDAVAAAFEKVAGS